MSDPEILGPHPGRQEQFLSTPADIAFGGGQAGGGKTFALLLEPLRHIRNPSFRAVIFRRTSPRITQEGGLWDTSFEVYPHLGAEPYQSPAHEWRFPSGSKVAFHHLEHEKNRLDWKGAQVPMIGWDQAEEFTDKQFWYLVSRNRSTCGVKPYIRATCNPVPPDDDPGGWVHHFLSWWIGDDGYPIPERAGELRWFIRHEGKLMWFDGPDQAREYRDTHGLHEAIEPKSVTFIPFGVEDNPTLMQGDPAYLSTLESLPKVERERLRGGNWLVRETAGEIFDRAWFDVVEKAPSNAPAIRYWDKAGTKDGGARSAGVKVSMSEDIFYIEDVVQGQWSAHERERVILQTAQADGHDVQVWVEQEPGSGGKESAEATIRHLAGYDVHAERVTGSKTGRARPMSAQAEAGNVKLVRGDWNESFLRQAHRFEEGANLIDAVDAAVGAFNKLIESAGPVFEQTYEYEEAGGFVA